MRTLIFLTSAVLILLLMGCGQTGLSDSGDLDELAAGNLPPRNPNISPEPITLEVWLDIDFTRDSNLFEALVRDFERVYPEVKVKLFSFVRESIPQKVELAVLSGIPPDVVQGHVYAVAGRGLAEPLDEQWQAWSETDPAAAGQFIDSALAEVTWKDKRYGVPLDIYTLVLIYNREHFSEANLPYPEGDYDLFYLRRAAEILTEPERDRYGMGFTTDPWYVYAWVTGAGGDVLVGSPEEGFTLTLDQQTNADALRFLSDMIEAGYGPRPTTRPRDYEDRRQMFLDGQISMYFGESQDIHLIQSTQPDFPLGVAQLPTTPARDSAASVLGSSGLFIPKGAQHKAVAFEFIKWATSDRYAVPMARRLGRYPAKNWLQTSPEFTENLSLIPFFNQLNDARPYRLDLFPLAEEAFGDAIKATFYDIATPAEALQAAQTIGGNTTLGPAP
ncbi:MAG: sugar ABC transporter substrate-binding protein [Anaerolineae bacterium]|nr:sugar ABC transporter substrate-binding protein [Anaerolineae bacterium]